MRDAPDAEKTFEERAYSWLASGAAKTHAEGLIFRKQIIVETKDVIDDTRRQIWSFFQRNPDHEFTSPPGAYCAVVMRNVVNEVLRGFKETPLEKQPNELDLTNDFVAPSDLGGGFTDQLRSAIETAGHPDWVTAAALNFVTLSAYPGCDVSDAPASKAGATPNQARLWPSLWFAGRRDGLFAGPEGGGAAQRKRLSRTGAAVQGLVDEAAQMVGAGAS